MNAAALVGSHEVLVFDLDGTLIDTAADIQSELNRALSACGIEPLPSGVNPPDLHSPMRGIVQAVFAARGLRADSVEAVVAAWQRDVAHPQREVRATLYPGVRDFLQLHEDRGCRMAVCTNKRQADAVDILARFGLLRHFRHIVGADTAERAKPDPAPLLLALSLLNALPTDALFFGDSHLDAQCAHHSKVRFAWHRGGYGGGEVLAHPIAVEFDSFVELEDRLVLPG